MAEDAGGAFEVGSAYVSVSPDAETFPEQLDEQLGGLDYVVTIPVRADTAGLQESVDAAAADAQAAIVLPVTADPAGLKESVDAASASSGAVITVPLEADPADLAPQADAAATAAGESAGTSFGEKFSSVASSASLFAPDEAQVTSAGTGAGEAAGKGFDEGFAVASAGLGEEFSAAVSSAVAASSAAWGEIPVAAGDAAAAAVARTTEAWGALIPAAAADGAEAGTAAGEGFLSRLGAMMSGVTEMFAGLIPAAATEGAAAGESAGEGFASRFAAMMSGVTGAFSGLVPGLEAEGAAAGTATGESFGASLKGVLMGSISPMEALLGAAFVAATADMASHFQSAMELVHTQAGVAQSAIAGLSGQVLTLAGKVGESPDSLAKALYHVESSFQSVGITGSAAMSLLQTAAEGARSGNANLVDVTNALDATIASGIGGIQNYSQAMGALNAIVGAGDMSMQDLADAMGSGLMAVAKSYGQSIDDIGAALATFGDNNIRGAKAATDLRMAMQAILAPVKTGEGALQHLGLTMTSLGDTMTHKGLTAAIAEFVGRLKAAKVPVSDWGQYVTEIFGKKAGAGIGVLVDQLGRLQSKMPDVERGAKNFGSAWAATQATVGQKLKELESSFQTLMIKIGNGLLPAVSGLLDMVNRDLPGIEKFGASIAHLVAPAVTGFFRDLGAILKELLGPLRTFTEVFGIAILAMLGIYKVIKVIEGLRDAWIALNVVMAENPFILIGAAIAALAFLIVKYHKQIWDVIKKTWDDVAGFFTGLYDKIARPVEKVFDDIRKYITTGFDKWWKSHGEELEAVWKAEWTVIRTVFTETWDLITDVVKTAWDLITGILKPGLDLLLAVFKVAWDAITAVFKVAWDVIAAVVKAAVAAVELVIKTAWDVIVGIFNVFLDLITGHWSKAWNDLKAMLEQVWNNIRSFLGSVWNAIYNLVVQVVNALKGFLVTAWDDIKGGVVSAFDDVRHEIAAIWDGILHDIEAVVDKIKSVISSVVSAPGHVVSSVLGAVGLARGGVLAGYAPGHDTVNAKLSPGEAVLVPEAVRAIGPGRINAINAHYSAGRTRGGDGAYAGGGVVSYYAAGGIADGGLSPYEAGQAAGQAYTASQGGSASKDGATFNLYFQGTQWPTPEQQQAMMSRLALLAGAM